MLAHIAVLFRSCMAAKVDSLISKEYCPFLTSAERSISAISLSVTASKHLVLVIGSSRSRRQPGGGMSGWKISTKRLTVEMEVEIEVEAKIYLGWREGGKRDESRCRPQPRGTVQLS
jgi:hypothetical protein